MAQGADVPLESAAGLDDGSLGTDATAIVDALGAADRGAGVVVLMDLGSAVLSAELALELLDEAARERVVLCAAPLVEGLVAACVAAAGGAARDEVAAEALAGLAGKQSHLGAGVTPAGPAASAPPGDAATARVVVDTPHGLHARPAARLVQAARAAGTPVEVRNATTGSQWAPATSLTRVAALGVLRGHELELRADGPSARTTLDVLTALVGQGDDAAPEVGAPPPPAGGPLGASPGVAVGPARVEQAPAPSDSSYAPADPPGEHARLLTARDTVRAALRATRRHAAAAAGEVAAAVFDAHLLLLDDDELVDDARVRVEAGEPAPAAWQAAVTRAEAALRALSDPYLRARADDVRAVGDDVLRALLGEQPAPAPDGPPGVLLADDLTPSQAAALDPAQVLGVVLAGSSPTSHSAILVRALGLPAVVAAGPDVRRVPEGTVVALDGTTGELAVGEDSPRLAALRRRGDEQARTAAAAAQRSAEPARTRDGTLVRVAANVGSVEDARLAAQGGADLAGLVRTELLFLDRASAPDVEEQEAVYRSLAEALGGRRMTLRTLDVGGDKPLPYVPRPPEANPFLGLRGLRLSLAVPGLLEDQLLAVVRVARETPVSVMFPMVTTLAELLAARRVLDTALARTGRPPPSGLEVGIMVEVPAAALKTRVLAPHVDFLSVGTNDLAQYALAVERGNPAVAALSDPRDPGVLALVAATCAGAGGTPVAVCGELAADEGGAALLVGLGVRELSVGPRSVARVKQAVRDLDAAAAAATARSALAADDAAAVRALLS